MNPDGTNLRQLTHTRAFTEANGVVEVELPPLRLIGAAALMPCRQYMPAATMVCDALLVSIAPAKSMVGPAGGARVRHATKPILDPLRVRQQSHDMRNALPERKRMHVVCREPGK